MKSIQLLFVILISLSAYVHSADKKDTELYKIVFGTENPPMIMSVDLTALTDESCLQLYGMKKQAFLEWREQYKQKPKKDRLHDLYQEDLARGVPKDTLDAVYKATLALAAQNGLLDDEEQESPPDTAHQCIT